MLSNNGITIDFHSDTLTKPTPGMRIAIANAEVGNEQSGEDPTVNHLCQMVCELTGKEAAVYLPSGTMCNQIAFRIYCDDTGDEIICENTSHCYNFEAGGIAALSRASINTINGKRGIFTLEQFNKAVRQSSRYYPKTKVVVIEQTTNFGGGAIWSLEQIKSICNSAKELGISTHMDGARLMNAVVASGISAKSYSQHFDSVWMDFSKGLGAPVGAVLAGTKEFIAKAWRLKQQMGGAMRQAGIIAAACVYALEHNIDRLAEDHKHASMIATKLASLDAVNINSNEVETNIICFTLKYNLDPNELKELLFKKGIRIGVFGDIIRIVTHLDISYENIVTFIDEFKICLNSMVDKL